MHLAKGPQAEPILLPLLVCCVDVALEAVVLYQEDGDKALGASFVAWGLEGRFFLQQEERSRHLVSKIQEIHPPHAQHRDRLCGLANNIHHTASGPHRENHPFKWQKYQHFPAHYIHGAPSPRSTKGRPSLSGAYSKHLKVIIAQVATHRGGGSGSNSLWASASLACCWLLNLSASSCRRCA